MTPVAGICHLDMDAFFAAVELRRHPELVGQPVVVGGSGPRGVVAAASYEARAYGIGSAMPGARARRLCPHAVFLDGDHDHYREVSAEVMAIVGSVTPLVEPLSLDEAFLDVRGARRLHGEPVEIAHHLRQRIFDEQGLTCSVGIARVKFLAKLATSAAKPRPSVDGPIPGPGVFEVRPDEERAFLDALPVAALWGVGPATLERLRRLGVSTVADLAALRVETLVAALGEASGRHLHDLAHARDPRRVEPEVAPKSISHEETFAHDRTSREQLGVEVIRLADAVGTRLRNSGLAGRTVTLKVRFGDFTTITRSTTVGGGISSGHELAKVGRRLLADVDVAPGVRLIGLGVSGLGSGSTRQLSMDDLLEPASASDWTDVERAVDEVRARFGATAVGPASLAGPAGLRVARKGQQQWGPAAAPDGDASSGRPR